MDMQLEKTIYGWVAEFMIRRPNTGEDLTKILFPKLDIPNDNIRFEKTVILRSISDEISDGSVSETILDSLETIEVLDRKEGFTIMASMKRAYCAVAVECTVKYLAGGGSVNGKYLDAVKRVFRTRIEGLERSGESELVCCSDELVKWREKIEAVVGDSRVCKELLERNTRNDALKLVREYIDEAFAILGPPFLELAVRKMKEKEERMKRKEKEEEVKKKGFGCDCVTDSTGERAVSESNVDPESCGAGGVVKLDDEMVDHEKQQRVDDQKGDNDGGGHEKQNDLGGDPLRGGSVSGESNAEMESGGGADEVVELEDEMVDKKEPKTDNMESGDDGDGQRGVVGTPNASRGTAAKGKEFRKDSVGFADPEDLRLSLSLRSCDSNSTPKYNKVREELNTSILELGALVTCSLPDALQLAKTVRTEMAKKNMNHETPVINLNKKDTNASKLSDNERGEPVKNASNLSANKNTEPIQAEEVNHGNQCCDLQNDAAKRSLMERNRTAHTYEWDDSIDCAPEGASSHMNRFPLPSPKRRAVSPLKRHETTKFVRRRKMKKWSVEEEDVLRKAVQKYGKGNWKLILNGHSDVFSERTEVDLKDKWRNMTRY